MFVKVIRWKVVRNEKEILERDWTMEKVYDCESASISPQMITGEGGEQLMDLVLLFSDGRNAVESFPVMGDKTAVSIFYMNSQGKTVERYTY